MAGNKKLHVVIVLNQRGQEIIDSKFLCCYCTHAQAMKISDKLSFQINLLKEFDYVGSFNLVEGMSGFESQAEADEFMRLINDGLTILEARELMERM